jgi:predicted hydrocarbon binding protein/DNA-binding HxlR family transcriptional regulator
LGELLIYSKYNSFQDIMAKPETKTEFFYTEKGLVAVDSPVKLQILNLLREEPKPFDEIVKYTVKAKSTISVHLNDLRLYELVEEKFDPEDRRKKIYSLTSRYMGCSQKPSIGHYRSLLEAVAANGNDKFRFMEALYHTLRFGFEAYGIDNSPVVKMIGIDIGKHLSSNFESNTLEALLNEIAVFLEFHGDCHVSVLMENSPALRVEDGFKAMSMPVTGKPFCALREGIIEGILKEKLGKECGALEIECYGTGHAHCLFEITI